MRDIDVFDPGLDVVAGALLLECALLQRQRQPNCRLGMQTKGWCSLKQTAAAWDSPGISALDNMVMIATAGRHHHREYWFVICDPGGSIDWHDHRQSDRAMVYWPRVPDRGEKSQDVGGYLEFDGEGPTLQPMQGQMVLFEGTDRHRVQPYTGDGLRFSISCNLS